MYFFYNLFLVIVFPFFKILPIFIPKLKFLIKNREEKLNALLHSPFKKDNKKVIWLHSASVGELDQAKAFASVLREKNKDIIILQSVFSASVTDKQILDEPNYHPFFLPFDFPFSYDKIIKKFEPNLLIIFAWDSWPNLIRKMKLSGAKTYLVCASLSESSGRANGIGRFLTKAVFSYLDGIFPAHESLEPLFNSLVSENTTVQALGDTRFDAVINRIETKKPSSSFQAFESKFNKDILSTKPILFGSTYPICESHLLQYLEKYPGTKDSFWIFPHKWDSERMSILTEKLKAFGSVSNFSEMIKPNTPYPKFLLFDEMGILAFAYQYALFAYVGGAIHNRIHNTIEPAAFGLPLITGTKMTTAPEAIVLRKIGGLFVFSNQKEFDEIMNQLSANETETRKIGEKNRKFVLENRGASERIYERVFPDAFS